MDIQDKIKKRRLELGLSLEDVAKQLNVNRSTVLRYETKDITRMPIDIVKPLAKVLHVSPEYLMGWEDDIVTEIAMDKIVFDDYFPLHYSLNLSAESFNELIEAEPDAVVYVPIIFQGKKKRLLAFKVSGTSMNNVIEDGSIVVVDNTSNLGIHFKDGTVIVAYYEGMVTVKRIYEQEDRIVLMPDSTDKSHMPITIMKDGEPLTIVGKVIWHCNPDNIAEHY